MKIWQKADENVCKKAEKFTAGKDVLLDQRLVFWDAVASIAHAKMLCKIGVLKVEETAQLVSGLGEIIKLEKNGGFALNPEYEDVHSNIEFFLTQKLGEAGKKIHAGRSRNDQAACALALFSKSQLLQLSGELVGLCSELVVLGKTHAKTVMPGYTHMQKAMPTTFGHWALYHAEMLVGDLEQTLSVLDLVDKNPLGAGASYGSILPLDVEMTTKLLGFNAPHTNSIAAVASRGKKELVALQALASVMQSLSNLAQDLLLFSTSEFGFVSLHEDFCTGSSIMPQKKNADVLELVKGKAGKVFGCMAQAFFTKNAMPLGYNRDIQENKQAVFEAFDETIASADIMKDLLASVSVDEKKMQAACTLEIFAADLATRLVHKGVPFREAYKTVGSCFKNAAPAAELLKHFSPDELAELTDAQKNICLKKHAGAPGDAKASAVLQKTLDELSAVVEEKKELFEKCISELY